MKKPDLRTDPVIAAVDLFCGVGGLTHGLESAGIEVRAGFDLDPACGYPYDANNAAKFVHSDVITITPTQLASHLGQSDYTLIAGCAPCQPFSTMSRASRKVNGASASWRLLHDFGRIVEEVSPDFVTMENVSELARHQVFESFVNGLSNYSITWAVVDLARYGIPQSRRRLVLIASKHGEVALPKLAHPDDVTTVRDTIGSLPRIAAGESDLADPLHTSPKLSDLNLERIKNSRPGGTWRDWNESLRAACHRAESGATYPSVYGRMEWDRAAPTITTQFYGYGSGRFGHPDQDRAISIREGAMLQTFPRNYRFVDSGRPVRFNALGRLIGNAVPVRLGKLVGQQLVDHARELRRRGQGN